MSFLSNGGKFKLYTVLNALIFPTPTQSRISFERAIYYVLSINYIYIFFDYGKLIHHQEISPTSYFPGSAISGTNWLAPVQLSHVPVLVEWRQQSLHMQTWHYWNIIDSLTANPNAKSTKTYCSVDYLVPSTSKQTDLVWIFRRCFAFTNIFFPLYTFSAILSF
jgi:hypothetical protein